MTPDADDELPPLSVLTDMLVDAIKLVDAVEELTSQHRRQAGEDRAMIDRLAHVQDRLNHAWATLKVAHRQLERSSPDAVG